MEDVRTYRIEEETTDEERELASPPSDDEVPFHIPRD